MGRAEKNSFPKTDRSAELNVRRMRGLLKHRTPPREYLENGSDENRHETFNSE